LFYIVATLAPHRKTAAQVSCLFDRRRCSVDGINMREFNQNLIAEFRANGGKLSGRLANSHILLLTTTGARSGQPRIVPLGYGQDGGRLVVVAANAGAPAHPDWYYNLVAHPDVTVELGSERFAAHATVAQGAERADLLNRQASIVPWLPAQQEKTSREIPIVVLWRLEPTE
jgi:deazaflavin-dependent oxidoreductase (nitroreductase family)